MHGMSLMAAKHFDGNNFLSLVCLAVTNEVCACFVTRFIYFPDIISYLTSLLYKVTCYCCAVVDMYYGGDSSSTLQTLSYTCSYCGQMGFSIVLLLEHIRSSHGGSSGTAVTEVVSYLNVQLLTWKALNRRHIPNKCPISAPSPLYRGGWVTPEACLLLLVLRDSRSC